MAVQQMTPWQDPSVKPANSGNIGMKKGIARLNPTGEYGAGMLDRQILQPEFLQQLYGAASGAQMSAAEQLMRAGLAQQQGQAYGLAASGANAMNPALAMRQAQEAAGQAGLQAQSQFGAMRADEMAKAQAMYAQTMFGQQQMNDQAAQAREAMLNQLIQTKYNGNVQQAMQDQAFWQQVGTLGLGGAMSGAGQAAGAALLI